MIYVPSYQVIAFLDWLCNHGMILPDHQLNGDERKYLQSLATEFLKGRLDVENQGKNHSLMQFLLRVFQSCDGISESSIEAQMAHFATCGSCFHFFLEFRVASASGETTSRGQSFQDVSWAFWERPLHPLLNGFHAWIIDNQIENFLGAESNSNLEEKHSSYIDHLEGILWFRRFIRERRELQKEFNEYIRYVEQHDPSLIEHYLRWRKEQRADKSKFEKLFFREFDEATEPINSEATVEESARRLADSAVRAWSNEYRELFSHEMQNGSIEHRMSMIVQEKRLLPQSLEFLEWLKNKKPNLRLPGSIPVEEFKGLVLDFCNQKGYSNSDDFAKEATSWIYGKGSWGIMNKIRGLFGMKDSRRSFKNPQSGTGNPLDRYEGIRFHGVFLMANSNGYAGFIKQNWDDLNSMTGDWLDLYYSQDDLNGVNGYDSSKMFKSFQATALQIPSLVLWENLSNPIFITLEGLMDSDIMEVVKHVVTCLQSVSPNANANVSGSGIVPLLTQAATAGNNKSQELRLLNKQVSSVVFYTFTGVGVANVSNNSNNNNNNRGSVNVGGDMIGNAVQQNVGNLSLGTTLKVEDIDFARALIDYLERNLIDGLNVSQQKAGVDCLKEIQTAGTGENGGLAIKNWSEWLRSLPLTTLQGLQRAFPTIANVVTCANDNVVRKAIVDAVQAFTL